MSQILEIGGGSAANGTNSSAVATITMKAGYTLATDDALLVIYSNGRTTDQNLSSAISVTGTTLADSDEDFQTDDFPVNARYELHQVTGTPPSSVTGAAAGAANNACSITVKVLRGVNWSNPINVTKAKVKAGNSGVPNPGANTPTVEGSLVVVAMASSIGNDSSYTQPAGFVEQRGANAQGSATGCMSALAQRLAVPANEAIDPAAWTGLTSAASETSIVWTISLEPADTSVAVYVMHAVTGTTSATLGEHRAGDLIYVAGDRDGSNSQNGAYPAGYSDIAGVGGDSMSWRAAVNAADSSSESNPSSTNATTLIAVVLRAATGYTISHGVIAVGGPGPGTTIDWSALTGMDAGGQSRLLMFGFHRSVNTTLGATWPSGVTAMVAEALDATDHGVAFWLDAATASWSLAQTSVGGTSSQWRTLVIEVIVTSTAHTATGALTLPLIAIAGAADVSPRGAGALSLPVVAVAGAAAETFAATGALSLPLVSLAGTGVMHPDGVGALTLPLSAIAGSAAETFAAQGAITLPTVAIEGAAAEGFTATGALSLPTVLVDGSGVMHPAGDGALSLPLVAVAGEASSTLDEPTGAGALSLPLVTIAAAAVETIAGDGALTLPVMAIAGQAAETIAGAGVLTLPAAVVAAAGAEAFSAAGALTVPAITVAGAASETMSGSGALSVPAVSLAGAGAETVAGAGAVALAPVAIAATAEQAFAGTGAIALPVVALAGVAALAIPGTGALQLATIVIAGLGESALSVTLTPDIITVRGRLQRSVTVAGTRGVSTTARGMRAGTISAAGQLGRSVTVRGRRDQATTAIGER